jgi:PKD domain/Kelch motif
MRMKFFSAAIFILVVMQVILSCKKEKLCDNCNEINKPPIAIAGPDQLIALPTDSVLLDGRSSSDPDGTISNWLWTKISGPALINFNNSTSSFVVVKNLIAGTYLFELKVTDNGGLSARDTMQVIVNSTTQTNRPPVAKAGADQTITFPVNTVTLNGSGSTDPDNNITSYLWTKVSGPSTFDILNANAIQTQVSNLFQGVYRFELKVTDAGGLFSKDTVQVTAVPANAPIVCDSSNRPVINAQLIPFATLPFAEEAVASGTKIFFAGGTPDCGSYATCSLRVDIYDTVAQTWSTHYLDSGRWNFGAVANGNKVFFAGGRWGDGAYDQLFSRVDIYDNVSGTWSVAALSEPRAYLAAAATGNKVLFAGGEKDWSYNTSNRVDIYDITSNTWSTAQLSEARSYIAASSLNDKVYFAGGHREDIWYQDPSNRIDIYNGQTNSWSTSSLLVHTGTISSIALNENIYWSSGCPVEKRNSFNASSTINNLHQSGGYSSGTKNGKVVFMGGGDRFDIYDPVTNIWSVGLLPQSISAGVFASFNNTILVSNGTQIWKLEF